MNWIVGRRGAGKLSEMNHSKLIEVIDSWIDIRETIPGDRKTWKALRAVAMLHRPTGEYCQRCTVNNWGVQQQKYPCDEIRAIKKELQ